MGIVMLLCLTVISYVPTNTEAEKAETVMLEAPDNPLYVQLCKDIVANSPVESHGFKNTGDCISYVQHCIMGSGNEGVCICDFYQRVVTAGLADWSELGHDGFGDCVSDFNSN